MKKILVYGYGNPGRQDDAMGNILVDELKEWAEEKKYSNIDFDSNYQLNIEDADNISGYDEVYFIDASIEEEVEDFLLTDVKPSKNTVEFTMHAVSPGFVLDLCKKMYDNVPETYLLHLKGYEWEFMEEITEKAQQNLNKGIEFMKKRLDERGG